MKKYSSIILFFMYVISDYAYSQTEQNNGNIDSYLQQQILLQKAEEQSLKTDLALQNARNALAAYLASEMRKSLPKVDGVQTHVNSYAIGSNLISVYQIYDRSMSDNEIVDFYGNNVAQVLNKAARIDQFCDDVELAKMLNLGITSTYIYTLRNGEIFMQFKISKSDCTPALPPSDSEALPLSE